LLRGLHLRLILLTKKEGECSTVLRKLCGSSRDKEAEHVDVDSVAFRAAFCPIARYYTGGLMYHASSLPAFTHAMVNSPPQMG
jgi:hypothetical protein